MIQVKISIGELIDKLSILDIKKNNIKDTNKLVYVEKEYNLLMSLSEPFLQKKEIQSLYRELVTVNSELWDIEDKIRDFELLKRFDDVFINLARKVYMTNDKRFSIKNQINELTNSEIKEVKDYKDYK